jgi:hypothetical protein
LLTIAIRASPSRIFNWALSRSELSLPFVGGGSDIVDVTAKFVARKGEQYEPQILSEVEEKQVRSQ